VPGAAAALVQELRPHVADERVLAAIEAVARDRFVPASEAQRAWANEALPIAAGQTISQPLVVARMCLLLELRGDETVLDVGTGSGYHAAVLAQLAAHVHSVEWHASLSESAREALAAAGVSNVTLHVGDGSRGLPALAPFGAVNVAAAGPASRLHALLEQLAPGGRLVAPIDVADDEQALVVVRRDPSGALHQQVHERVRFVPLLAS
jgi:protein-L-isoaspartate(D-aspartate) O-methyltransferase